MKSYEKLTPEGTRDFLFEESDALRRIERGLSELFKEKGYKKVITPTVEFLTYLTVRAQERCRKICTV